MVSRSDAALSASLLILGQLEVWVAGAAGGSWPASLTLAAAAALLLLRRRAPIAVAFAVLGCQFVCAAFHEPDAMTFGLLSIVAWYSVGRWTSTRRGLISLAVVLGLAVVMVDAGGSRLDVVNLYLSVALTGFVVPWLVGYVIRGRAAARVTMEPTSHAEQPPTGAGPDLGALSPREREVFTLLARGATNAEIAAELFLSIYTVKAHVASILAKLGLRDRVQVAVFARDTALGSGEPRRQTGAVPSSTATSGSSMTRPPASSR